MSEGAIDQIVEEANQEVKAHGLQVSVLIRFVTSRDETNEQTDFQSLPGTVNQGRYGTGDYRKKKKLLSAAYEIRGYKETQ